MTAEDYERTARVEGTLSTSSRSDLTGRDAEYGVLISIDVDWGNGIRMVHPPRQWDLEELRINGDIAPDATASTYQTSPRELPWQTYRNAYSRLSGNDRYRRTTTGGFQVGQRGLKTHPQIITRLIAHGEFAFARTAVSIFADWDPEQATAALNDDWNLTLLTTKSDSKIGPGIINVRLDRRNPRTTGAFPNPAVMDGVPTEIAVFNTDHELIHTFKHLRWSETKAIRTSLGTESYNARPLVTDHALPDIRRVRVGFIPGLERRQVTVDLVDLELPDKVEKTNTAKSTVTVGPPLKTQPPVRQPLRLTAIEWHPYSRPDEKPDPDVSGRLSLKGFYDPTLSDGWRLLPETFAVTRLAENGTDLLKPTDDSGRRHPPLPELPDPDELADALWSLSVGQTIQQQQRNPNLTNLPSWSASATLIRPPAQDSVELGITAMALRNGEVTTTLVPIPEMGGSKSLNPELSLWRRPNDPDAKYTELALNFKLDGVTQPDGILAAPAVPVSVELVSRDDPPRSLRSNFFIRRRGADPHESTVYGLTIPAGVDLSRCQLRVTWARDLELKIVTTEPQQYSLKKLPKARGF
ncbi:MAG: hypothetical protein AAGH99_08710 [Planctomycetota bacterium]